MLRSELITRVKIKLDEYAPAGVVLPFDDYIGPLLDESARDLLERAPLYLMTPTSIPLTGTVFENDKSFIPVPADYVRLYEVKYPLWKKSVRMAISREHPDYKVQENEFLTGGYGRPSVAIVLYLAVKHFECAKVLSGATPVVATYVKTNTAEYLNDILSDTLTWLTASKIFAVTGYEDKAKMMIGLSNQSLAQLII